MESMVEEITRRVLGALKSKHGEPRLAPHAMAPLQPAVPQPAPPAPAPAAVRAEPVRRVTALRVRSSSILGLDLSRPEPAHEPSTEPE